VLPNMRAKDVEKAQDLVIAVARKLDEEGAVSLDLSD